LYSEVRALFPQSFQVDKNRRRAYQSVHDYAWALKGLHAQSVNGFALPADFQDGAMQAKLWLEECVSFGYHTALDNVLLAYMRSILGLPEDESLEALSALNPIGGGVINELEDLSKQRPEGAAAGLLLGLSDPAVWDLVGTYLKTWTAFKDLAIRFYEKARLLEPAHPMHAFNKALVLADLQRFPESRVALDECLRKRSNRRNWSKANENSIENLRVMLQRALDGSAA